MQQLTRLLATPTAVWTRAYIFLKIGIVVFLEVEVKAVSYEGVRKMSVSDHPKPKLRSPTDALFKVTTIGICGNDLYMYDGRTPLKEGECRRPRYAKVLIKFGREQRAA